MALWWLSHTTKGWYPGIKVLAGKLLLAPLPFLGRYNLLNLPIVYKLVVANSALVLGGGVLGIWLAHFSPLENACPLNSCFCVTGLLLGVVGSGIANYLIINTAMAPLASLQRTVERVRDGHASARAEDTILSDPGVQLLQNALNEMLDRIGEDRERLRSLSAGLIMAQEEERERVARELHDEVGQTVTALLIRLKCMEKGPTQPGAEEAIGEATALAAAATEAVRQVAYQLRPRILEDLGLVAALESFADECRRNRPNLRAEFHVRGFAGRLPTPVETVLYRVVREALWNVVRHSQASQVMVRLEWEGDRIRATVEDDGVGFDVEEILGKPATALGLLGMQERITMLGGSLVLESHHGAGCIICMEIPVS